MARIVLGSYMVRSPRGEGLFAVSTPEEAAGAIETLQKEYGRHARAHLDVRCVLGNFLRELGF